MSKRVIHLPAINKRLPLGAYVAVIKIKTGLDWCTGAEIVEQFRAGMHHRINDISRGK